VEGQAAIRVDRERVLGDILLLFTQSITHAITRLLNVGEGHSCVADGHSHSWALHLLFRHLDVDIEIGRCHAGEISGDVNDEWHTALVLPRRGRSCSNRLLLEFHARVAVAVEGQAAIRVDRERVLGDILLLFTQSITHAITRLLNVGEGHSCVADGHSHSWALHLLFRHLDVDIEIGRGRAGKIGRDVNDEWHTALVLPRGGRSCSNRFLLEFHVRVAVTVEGQAAIGVDGE